MTLAVWGHPYSEYPEGQDSIDDFRRGFEKLRRAGVDLYMAFVLTHGKAYFRSKTLGDPERDLLAPVMQCPGHGRLVISDLEGLLRGNR